MHQLREHGQREVAVVGAGVAEDQQVGARRKRVGVLLGGTQAAVTLAPAKLLGRVSPTAGGPEPVDVGLGLAIRGAALAATGLDHAQFEAAAGLSFGDEVVLNSAGQPRRLPATALRGLFSAGPGVTLQNGVISAPGGGGGGVVPDAAW